MKRSEMISKLKFWIDDNTWANDDRGVSDYARDHTDEELDKLANSLMDWIETAGMLPPPLTFYKYEDHIKYIRLPDRDGIMCRPIYSEKCRNTKTGEVESLWEPEDE